MPNIKYDGSIPFDLFIFPMEKLSLRWKLKIEYMEKEYERKPLQLWNDFKILPTAFPS